MGNRPSKSYYLERQLIQKHPLSTAMKKKKCLQDQYELNPKFEIQIT